MFSVLISCRPSGGDGTRSLGCNVSVWPESMWEREHSPRFHCHGTLTTNHWGGLPGHQSQSWQRLSPVEHLHLGHAGPRKSLCLWWSSASNVPLQTQSKQQKDNLLLKKDSLCVFIQVVLLSPMSSPTYFLCIIQLSELKRFSMAFELESVASTNPSKDCGQKLNSATGEMKQSDHLNVFSQWYIYLLLHFCEEIIKNKAH